MLNSIKGEMLSMTIEELMILISFADELIAEKAAECSKEE